MEYQIDAQNLLCPMPVIKLQQMVENCKKGDRVQITFTDPGGKHDIPAWCRVHGHHVLSIDEQNQSYCIAIEICAP